jgi:hypothetical protein
MRRGAGARRPATGAAGPRDLPRLVGVEEVARVGRLVHRRLYLRGHHPGLGVPILGWSGPETVIERLGLDGLSGPAARQ